MKGKPLASSDTTSCTQMLVHLLDQTNDNGAALMSLIERYISHFCRRYCNLDFDERQDVLQEVAIKLLCHGGKMRENCPKSWIYTVVRNQCINHIRNRSLQTSVFKRFPDGQEESHATGSLPLLNQSADITLIDELDCLEKVFERVEAQQTGKADVLLYTLYAFGLSYAEISQRSQRTVDAIGTRISLLKKRIKAFTHECC